MTEQQTKEYLSRHFIGLVASRRGFKTTPIQPDNGTDLLVNRAIWQERPNGVHRLVDAPEVLHVQLKCTCRVSTIDDGDGFKYDLEVTAYNDLVDRWQGGSYNKSLLVLMVLPDDPSEWLTIGDEELVVRRAAYWYEPPPDATLSENKATVRVRIPYTNLVTLELFDDKFVEYYQ